MSAEQMMEITRLQQLVIKYESLFSKQPEIRDHFAMAALQGILAADMPGSIDYEKSAEWAYRHADAMMQARKK